jgi:hypothetical protein
LGGISLTEAVKFGVTHTNLLSAPELAGEPEIPNGIRLDGTRPPSKVRFGVTQTSSISSLVVRPLLLASWRRKVAIIAKGLA